MRVLSSLLLVGLVLASAFSSGNVLVLSLSTRSTDTIKQQADSLVLQFAKNVTSLTAASRAARAKAGHYHTNIQFSVPSVVLLQGRTASTRHAAGGLVLQFDSSGSEAFPTAYQSLLQSVFTAAEPLMTALYGMPAVGGTVHVANFDSSIGDRQAVAGGYYMPDNGSGVPEIRFPVYNANESAAVNFIHCLLLAYRGPYVYGFDAYDEGLVRAVTMRIARTSGSLPSSLDQTVVEETLDNTYDIGATYEWNNQRALSASQFIASNLISGTLPATGGSGPYLLRYMMAGSAWSKVLVEYPSFAANFNSNFYANPSIAGNASALVAAGQSVLNTLNPTTPTIENRTFSDWVAHQYILDTTDAQGNKLLVNVTPITSGLTTGDFGVFVIEAIYFNRDASGNENLLSATSYPIYWDNNFLRIDTNVQDENMSIIASEGSLGPNFPDLYSGKPYNVSIDVPVSDQLQRVSVPAGAIATASTSTANDFYGTVEGVAVQSGDTLVVRATVGSNVFADIPVTNGAFGTTLGSTANFDLYASVDVKLIRTRSGVSTVLLERVFDKNPGGLAVDLSVGSDGMSYPVALPAGVSMVGLPIDPYTSNAASVFGVSSSSLLLGRYDSSKGGFYLYPNVEAPRAGHSYFLRLDTAQPSFAFSGRQSPNVSTTVALKPGWNMISVPLPYTFSTTGQVIRVLHAADFPVDYSSATGSLIGTDIFEFVPGTADSASGVPEGGTFVATTNLQPGVGYYVRVLSAEGVSLTFDPPSTTLASYHRETASVSTGNRLKVTAKQTGQMSYVIVGNAPTGRTSLNLAVDSQLPPGIGGFQASVADSSKGTLFRDIRGMGSAQAFTVNVAGLTVGKNVTLDFSTLSGVIRTFKIVNRTTGKVRTMLPGQTYSFTATATSQSFDIYLGAK